MRQYGRRAKEFRRHEAKDFILTPGAHEGIIDRELFERVQWHLAANAYQANPAREGRTRPHRPRKKRVGGKATKRMQYRLSGLLVCGHCGARMAGNTTIKGKIRYYCSTRKNYGLGACNVNAIDESLILQRLFDYIEKHLLNPYGLAEFHERRREAMNRLKKEQPRQLEALRRQEAELGKRIDGLTSKLGELAQIADAGMMQHYHESIAKWKGQRESVQKQMADALRPPEMANLDAAARHAQAYLGQLRDPMEKDEPRRMRLLLSELVDRIELKFTTRQCPKRVRSRFDRGIIYVRERLECVASKTQGRL